ncbi:hypothetical protein PENSPDRAFT_185743 [Peniophora sp. CONT]|nr:hypothetical protein PENSPDRAFT_185743 [Peniophora sp. CONT]
MRGTSTATTVLQVTINATCSTALSMSRTSSVLTAHWLIQITGDGIHTRTGMRPWRKLSTVWPVASLANLRSICTSGTFSSGSREHVIIPPSVVVLAIMARYPHQRSCPSPMKAPLLTRSPD